MAASAMQITAETKADWDRMKLYLSGLTGDGKATATCPLRQVIGIIGNSSPLFAVQAFCGRLESSGSMLLWRIQQPRILCAMSFDRLAVLLVAAVQLMALIGCSKQPDAMPEPSADMVTASWGWPVRSADSTPGVSSATIDYGT